MQDCQDYRLFDPKAPAVLERKGPAVKRRFDNDVFLIACVGVICFGPAYRFQRQRILMLLISTVQVVINLSLDMSNQQWTYSAENRNYRRLLIAVTLASAVLAPVWSFPAMLKVVLLMGANVLVIPMVIVTLIYLLNQRDVMGEHTASVWRNALMVVCLLVSVVLAVDKFPYYLAMF